MHVMKTKILKWQKQNDEHDHAVQNTEKNLKISF